MLTFATFKWKPNPGYRSQFAGEHVNTWAKMINRHHHEEHRLVVVTDDPTGIDPDLVEIMPLWGDYSDLRSPHPNQRHFPSCYRRLRMFSKEAREMFGERVCATDLDIVITDDITELLNRDEDVVFWGDTARNTHYNGSFYLLRTGTRTKVWDTFNPQVSPQVTYQRGIVGSDQAWISYILGGDEAKWSTADGILSFRLHVKTQGVELPKDAKVVIFHGAQNPWDEDVQRRYRWVREHYR